MKNVSQMFDSPSAHPSRSVDISSTCTVDSLKVSDLNVNHQIVEASDSPLRNSHTEKGPDRKSVV